MDGYTAFPCLNWPVMTAVHLHCLRHRLSSGLLALKAYFRSCYIFPWSNFFSDRHIFLYTKEKMKYRTWNSHTPPRMAQGIYKPLRNIIKKPKLIRSVTVIIIRIFV